MDRIDLDRARREAKALLRAARAGEPDALARLGAAPAEAGAAEPPRLADAQRAVARELGEASWPRLVHRAEAEAVARDDRARRFVEWATDRRRDHADALLAVDPSIARSGLDAALVLGDAQRVRAELPRAEGPIVADGAAPGAGAVPTAAARAAELANRPLGARGWPALCYVCHSAYLGSPDHTDGLLDCARALLEAGADPDSSWEHPEFGAQSALYGAAGVAHEPRMTALLLAAGANPDDGESVYHATEEPELRCLALLLDAGATVPGTNALGHALDRPDTAALEMLLPHVGADPATLRGLIPGAIWRERGPEFLRLLAAAGADVEETGSPGDGLRSHAAEANRRRRPYAIAVHIGRPDLAAVLAELGAEPVADPIDELVGAAVRGDRAAAAALVAGDPALRERLVADHAEMLVRSAAEGRAAGVALLHDLGVPLDTRGQLSGTALHHAAWHGDAEVVELLIDRGAPIDLPAPDTGGGTPLQWAAHGSVHGPAGAHRVVGERLVDAGAQVSPGIVEAATGELADWLESLAAEPRGRRRFDRDGRHGWGERDVAVHAAYLRALAALPESETRAVGDGFAVRTGVASNTENGVVAGAASDEEVAAAIAFLRGAPAQWVLTGSGATVGGAASKMAGAAGTGDPAALHDRLVAAGAQPERSAVVMGARVAALDLAGAPPAGVAIAPSDDLDAWLDLAARLGWLDDDAADRAGRRATLRAPGVRHWLAHRDGAPIGLATAFPHHDTLAGLHLGVLPEHRRQGVARALIRAALADTPAARVALLAPTRTTEPLYARLGFTTVPSPPDRVLYLPD